MSDPNNPEANAGIGIVLTFEVWKDLSDFLTEAVSEIFPFISQGTKGMASGVGAGSSAAKFILKQLTRIPRDSATKQISGITYEEFLQFLRDIHNKLSNAEKNFQIAIERGAKFEFRVNALDWDGDGTSEPYRPLKVTDGTRVYEVYKILYGMESPDFSSALTIDQSGGDAWFDFETISAILKGNIPPSSVGFTDSDYISIDEGELALLLAAVEILKVGVDIPLTWNLSLPQDFPAVNFYEDFNTWMLEVLSYIDRKGNVDGRIINPAGDGGEWNVLDPFLVFNEDGEVYLADFVKSSKGFAWTILKLDSDVEGDPVDIHDLTSRYYVEDVVDELTEGQLLELVNFGTITISEAGGSLIVDLNVLEENPERFDNLKKYFPTIEWDETGDYQPSYWPDPTFGGLLKFSVRLFPQTSKR